MSKKKANPNQLEIPVMRNEMKSKTIHLSKFHLTKFTIRAAEMDLSPKALMESILLEWLRNNPSNKIYEQLKP